MKIIPDFLTINYSKGRKGAYRPDAIVIHVTEGNAESVRGWFNNPNAEVSSHYLTTKKGLIYQFVREDDTAWANGRVAHPTAELVLNRPSSNPNWWTISIENEGSGHEELTTPQRKALMWLIRDIQSRHHRITSDRRHILRHNEIYSLKSCPGVISVDRIVKELNEPDFSDVASGSSTTDPTP
jgi:N-acetylmuramoyl-L-alanine amidase